MQDLYADGSFFKHVVWLVQHVVVIGGGAFACEAMRAAVNNGAASVVMVTREKSKCAISPQSY